MAHDSNRKMLITALARFTLANISLVAAATGNANVQGKSRILVAYFSRSENTRVIADVIHRSLNTVLFEIEPATPYPENYFQTVEQAKNKREQGVKPALKFSRNLRFTFPARVESVRLVSTASAPETAIPCPASPTVTPESRAIGVSRLTGINSEAISIKTHKVMAKMPPHYAC